ncbi:YopX family protein [Clostridium sp. ZBS18]|uniref:YopX family protein n=1 Tax=Clostridium sp. ZBS18 TaxID=2949967 RepID=UPI00207AACD8|nr:YopX family protein [Clostridium sp. ZBS18]
MSREIKFRAWDKEDKIMDYNIALVGNRILFEYSIEDDCIEFNSYVDINEENKKYFEIMQFTGFKDMNGKEIYEGDILQVSKEYSGSFQPTIVVFEDGCFKGQAYHKLTPPFVIETPITTLEVVGNIYENKELLEEQ